MMANGKTGDHPVNDICDHGVSVFSPKADSLIRKIHEYLPRYRMWDLFDWFNPPALKEFESQLERKLKDLQQDGQQRGWKISEEE